MPTPTRKAAAGETLMIERLELHDDGKWWALVLEDGKYAMVQLPDKDAEWIVGEMKLAFARMRKELGK